LYFGYASDNTASSLLLGSLEWKRRPPGKVKGAFEMRAGAWFVHTRRRGPHHERPGGAPPGSSATPETSIGKGETKRD
jgi:hypothetical protein